MPSPTMTVKNENLPEQARDLTHGTNRDLSDLSHMDPNMIREPDYFVYVFSVADRSFNVDRPTINVKLKTPFNSDAMHDKEAFALVWKVPSPYPLPYADQNSGEIRLNTVMAERAAMDICNPNQKSTDLDAYIPPEAESNIGLGDDLIEKGLFFVHERRCVFTKEIVNIGGKDTEIRVPHPPKGEVKKAVERKEKYYNKLLDKAKSLEYSNQKMLVDFIGMEPDAHLACEYFNVETSWHQVRSQKSVPVECPICGGEMKRGAPYHSLVGTKLGICVNNWEAAVNSGVVGEEDVPKAKRWWKEKTDGEPKQKS